MGYAEVPPRPPGPVYFPPPPPVLGPAAPAPSLMPGRQAEAPEEGPNGMWRQQRQPTFWDQVVHLSPDLDDAGQGAGQRPQEQQEQHGPLPRPARSPLPWPQPAGLQAQKQRQLQQAEDRNGRLSSAEDAERDAHRDRNRKGRLLEANRDAALSLATDPSSPMPGSALHQVEAMEEPSHGQGGHGQGGHGQGGHKVRPADGRFSSSSSSSSSSRSGRGGAQADSPRRRRAPRRTREGCVNALRCRGRRATTGTEVGAGAGAGAERERRPAGGGGLYAHGPSGGVGSGASAPA